MSSGNNSLPAIEPLRRSRLIEGCSLRVKLHVTRVDTGAIDPRVVQVVLSRLNEKNLEVVVEVGETVAC
jgi:hypothetical protein